MSANWYIMSIRVRTTKFLSLLSPQLDTLGDYAALNSLLNFDKNPDKIISYIMYKNYQIHLTKVLCSKFSYKNMDRGSLFIIYLWF